MKSKTCLTVITVLFLSIPGLFAQDAPAFSDSKHRVGFITGYGDQRWLGLTYTYEVYFFQLQYYRTLVQRDKWDLEVLIQPQYNTIRFPLIPTDTELTSGFEFGVNAGVLIRRYLVKDVLTLYAFLSAGPHFVPETPARQAKGFMFSDNLFAGLTIKLFKNAHLDLRPGFRHLSNAGLAVPNRGINTVVFSGGLLVNL